MVLASMEQTLLKITHWDPKVQWLGSSPEVHGWSVRSVINVWTQTSDRNTCRKHGLLSLIAIPTVARQSLLASPARLALLFCTCVFLRVECIPIDSGDPDVYSSGSQPEQAGGDGGGGDDISREETSPPIAGTSGARAVGDPAVTAEQCREGTDGVPSTGREETEEPLRWWLEVVGAGEVSPRYT